MSSFWDNPVTEQTFGIDFSGTVVQSIGMETQFGQVQVIWTVLRDEPFTKEDGTVVTESPVWFSVGSAEEWIIKDGGDRIEHRTNPDKMPSANSNYGKVLKRAVEEFDLRDALKATGKSPLDLSIWKGHRFHFMTEGAGKAYSFTDKETGEKKEGTTRGNTMPVEYLGTKDNPNPGTVGTSPRNGARVVDLASLAIPDDVLTQLRGAAGLTDDPAKFRDLAVDIVLKAGLGSNDALVDAVGNGGLYGALHA